MSNPGTEPLPNESSNNPSDDLGLESSEGTGMTQEKGFKESGSDQNGQSDLGNIQQGRWTDEEHTKFLDALRKYGKDWNKVHEHIGTRTSAQTRSHA